MAHEKFHYKTVEDIEKKCRELGVEIPFASGTAPLLRELDLGGLKVSNRMGIAPMEGADSTPDGRPGPYTERRYVREAEGGAGIIWYEAVSIVEEGRSSRTQLLLTKDTLDSFRRLNDKVKEAGVRKNGRAPVLVMQSNHSGRYSNPDNTPSPMIAERNSWLESFRGADDSDIVSDSYLEMMEEKTGEAARLAREAGFDAYDVKACHGYLYAEVLGAYGRDGRYGGSYENRTRLFRNSIAASKVHETPSFRITARLGIYDGYPASVRGWGQGEDGGMDLTEPCRLVKEIKSDYGLSFINITMGNPYATTHVTRPYDAGKYLPSEHPLEGIARMAYGVRKIKEAVPGMTVYASAPTYLREFSDLYASALVEKGWCDGVLFGRMGFADPGFPNEIKENGRIDRDHVCLTCGMCGDLIRSHKPTGCVIRDREVFMPFYREFLEEKKNLPANFRG